MRAPTDVFAEIERRAPVLRVRCDSLPGRLEIVDIAGHFGLKTDAQIYEKTSREHATRVVIKGLSEGLVYSDAVRPPEWAISLTGQFFACFEPIEAIYTNADSDMPAFMPATDATFDLGVIVQGRSLSGLVWFEDED